MTTVLCPVTVAIPLSQQQRQSYNSLVSEAFHDEVGPRSGQSSKTTAVGGVADTQRHPCAQPLEVRVVVLLLVLIGLTGTTAARGTPKAIRQKTKKEKRYIKKMGNRKSDLRVLTKFITLSCKQQEQMCGQRQSSYQTLRQQGENGYIHLADWTLSVAAIEKKKKKLS